MNARINVTEEQAYYIAMNEFKVHELLQHLEANATSDDGEIPDEVQLYLIKEIRRELQPLLDLKQFEPQ